MSTDDEFGSIQIDNIWEVTDNSLGALDVWLLKYNYMNI